MRTDGFSVHDVNRSAAKTVFFASEIQINGIELTIYDRPKCTIGHCTALFACTTTFGGEPSFNLKYRDLDLPGCNSSGEMRWCVCGRSPDSRRPTDVSRMTCPLPCRVVVEKDHAHTQEYIQMPPSRRSFLHRSEPRKQTLQFASCILLVSVIAASIDLSNSPLCMELTAPFSA